MDKKWMKLLVLILLMIWFGLFFFQKIDLTTADLGRHIKNGEMVLQGQTKILTTNFYSYTETDFPVINHHWGGGVIFYLLNKIVGFKGLSFLNIILNLIVFYLFFEIARREAGMKIAGLMALLFIPLMVARKEVRPEIFSYLGIATFYYLLWRFKGEELKTKWLYLLPFLQIIWVNSHIYFIFGPAIVGLFWTEEIIRKKKINKALSYVLILVVIACFISPFGLQGILYPFEIFRNYGYQIVENKSVGFLINWGFKDINLALYIFSLIIIVSSFVVQILRNHKQFSFIYFVLAVIWGVLGYSAIRNFSMFGFFAMIIVCYNLQKSKLKVEKLKIEAVVLASALIFVISFILNYQKLPWIQGKFGLGLIPNNNQAIEFYQKLGIKGSIFNNYDIGGYLIYHLYPKKSVFVDNRPEAYSVGFFQNIYIPAQTDNGVWQKLLTEYNFETIFFSHRDLTPWGQQFLIERVKDPSWVVIYYDQYIIIMIKRDKQNEKIIKKYEINKNIFVIR